MWRELCGRAGNVEWNDIYQSEEKISIYGQIRGRKYIGNFMSDLIGQTSSLHRQIQTF